MLIFPAPDEDSFNVDFLPDENLLKDIMGEYKTAAVFIPTGETQPDYRPDLQPLKPLLDVDVEETQYKAYLDVIKYIQENLSIGNNYE